MAFCVFSVPTQLLARFVLLLGISQHNLCVGTLYHVHPESKELLNALKYKVCRTYKLTLLLIAVKHSSVMKERTLHFIHLNMPFYLSILKITYIKVFHNAFTQFIASRISCNLRLGCIPHLFRARTPRAFNKYFIILCILQSIHC